jgi:AcrR family transcriptional regulator
MQPSQLSDEPPDAIPSDVRVQVMPAVLDELARWGVERFSIEALAERHRLDPAMIYRYWGDRQRLMVDAALGDLDSLRSAIDTGSLRGDLLALARSVVARNNTEVGRTLLRVLVMDSRAYHDEQTRVVFWQERFAAVRTVVDRARARGELREGVDTMAAVQMVLAPLNVRALYSDDLVDDKYCESVADLAWHAIARPI